MAADRIVIVGAGIIGLNVALVLCERGYGKQITVIAEYLPGDTAGTYTSPWAGCNFSAISGTDANALRWDRLGYAHLCKLASENPNGSFVHRTRSIEFRDENVPHNKIKGMSEYLEDVSCSSMNWPVLTTVVSSSSCRQVPRSRRFGVSFTILTTNAPSHTAYLYRRLREQYGVRFVRQKIFSIDSTFSSSTNIVFNSIGNAARTLAGVEDPKCYPTRGQALLTRAPNVRINIMRHGKDYETHVIPRPLSNGNDILGGHMQKGNGDGATYSYETDSILQRTKELSSELREKEFEVLAAFSGLRPSREGGARVEKEEVTVSGEKRIVVHNYGAGGTGFQAGYGMASDAVDAVAEILREVRKEPRPRL